MDKLLEALPNVILNQTNICCFGLIVSIYALYVEIKKNADKKYVAMCDFGENMNCSKVLTSEYSKGFGLTQYLFGNESFMNVPNCILGIVFYIAQIIFGQLSYSWAGSFLLYTSVISCIGSIYLAYILFFVLKDLCVVCITTYIVNFMLMYVNWNNRFKM